jgi:hypothetical protein
VLNDNAQKAPQPSQSFILDIRNRIVHTPDVARKLFASDRMMTGGLLPRFLFASSKALPLSCTRGPP